jgi:hypothetical protein
LGSKQREEWRMRRGKGREYEKTKGGEMRTRISKGANKKANFKRSK